MCSQGFGLVRELTAQGFPVAVACRVFKASTSGYYERRHRHPSVRDLDDAHLIHTLHASRWIKEAR